MSPEEEKAAVEADALKRQWFAVKVRKQRFTIDPRTGRMVDNSPVGLLDLGPEGDEFKRFLTRRLDIAYRVATSVALFGWNETITDRNPFPKFRIWGRR